MAGAVLRGEDRRNLRRERRGSGRAGPGPKPQSARSKNSFPNTCFGISPSKAGDLVSLD